MSVDRNPFEHEPDRVALDPAASAKAIKVRHGLFAGVTE